MAFIYLLNVDNPCEETCFLPPAKNSFCPTINTGSGAKIFASCEPIIDPAVNPGPLTGQDVYDLIMARLDNVTPTADDPSVIREYRICFEVPAPTETAREKRCGYPRQVTNRTRVINGQILDHNKCYYELIRQAEAAPLSMYITYLTMSCDLYIVEKKVSIVTANTVIGNTDDAEEQWNLSFEYDNLVSPQCVPWPVDFNLIESGDQCTEDETITLGA